VWDLDHTLLSTDTFFEQLATMLLRRPWLALTAFGWLLRGRAYCKGRVAALAGTSPGAWPVRQEALERIAADRAGGRTVVLATAAHHLVAGSIAEHLGCFDHVLSSDDRVNLKSRRKTDAIARLARAEGWIAFSYAGDSASDLPVWQEADEIIVVDPTPGLLGRLSALGKPVSVLGASRTGWASVLKACRPHQWAKNLLLFLPMFLAHRLEAATTFSVVFAFAAFSASASGVYVLNDIGDVEADRQHPRKRVRPFASGRLTIPAGLRLAALLIMGGLGVAVAYLPLEFSAILVLYLVANLAYSGRLKRVPVLDVLMLACMYVLRLEAGAVAANVSVSDWFLTFALFFFTSLAFVKRFSELLRLEASHGLVAAGRGYEVGDVRLLEMLGTASGYVSVLVLALYMNSEQMRYLYGGSRLLWLICPLVLYWITRLWLLANRGQVDEDPVVFALTDKPSVAIGAVCGLIVALASILAKDGP
jgi:4-hydroxybenzoate polyprenyltransferase/phosphoserine phosphatase